MKPNLSLPPEVVLRPPVAFVYVETHGLFVEKAPAAWEDFWTRAGRAFDSSVIVAMMSLSRTDLAKQDDERWVYRAGLALKAPPPSLPRGLKSGRWEGGKYARFLLTGSYAQLPAAFPAAYDALEAFGLRTREDFVVESYLNTPADTAEQDLLTEILLPIR